MKIDSFGDISWIDASNSRSHQIKDEIEALNKEYILNVTKEELCKYLFEKYFLTPLKILNESENFSEPEKQKEYRQDAFGRNIIKQLYRFTIKYKYEGNPLLFRIRPSTHIMTSSQININQDAQVVSFSFQMDSHNPDEFTSLKDQCYRKAFANLNNTNQEVERWNKSLEGTINNYFTETKEKYINENKFFEAIKLKISPQSKSIFSVPTIKKRIISPPQVTKTKSFSSEPTISTGIYEDILKVIYQSGKKMETKPSLYTDKDEEGLRDQILFILEDRYDSTTASGETFNKGGKTDILLKYAKDGTTLFIAECKFWKGIEEYYRAINQLFDRYLTWRDSKVALIVFVNNLDMTKVLNTIKSDTKKHPYFIKENGLREDTSLSYVFHLPSDKDKEVLLEVIVFHFLKK